MLGAASRFAASAGFDAYPAKFQVAVPGALITGSFTNFGAFQQYVLSMYGSAAMKANRHGAEIGRISAKADAVGRHCHIFLLEAGRDTVLTGSDAAIECVKQVLVLGMHGKSGLSVKQVRLL